MKTVQTKSRNTVRESVLRCCSVKKEKCVLKTCAKFTEKQLWWSLIKLQYFRYTWLCKMLKNIFCRTSARSSFCIKTRLDITLFFSPRIDWVAVLNLRTPFPYIFALTLFINFSVVIAILLTIAKLNVILKLRLVSI